MLRCLAKYLILVCLPAGAAAAVDFPKEPITGKDFERLISPEIQQPELQEHLRAAIAHAGECFVTGPLAPLVDFGEKGNPAFHTIRVMCPSIPATDLVIEALLADTTTGAMILEAYVEDPQDRGLPGYRGTLLEVRTGNESDTVQVLTVQQVRWLIWARHVLFDAPDTVNPEALERYATAVSDHLYDVDMGFGSRVPPVAEDYGLPQDLDVYAPAPDFVIQGYANYKAYLEDHRVIYREFAKGILSFIPGDSLLEVIISEAPKEAYPNKEASRLQEEYREFFRRGGDPRVMATLTEVGFDALRAGEYFFAVGITGRIRFGRELLREEVMGIEDRTGRKVPRANHAFLFPGEPLLTAGAFFVEIENGEPRLAEVNAQSGHYFYSNVSESIRVDITERSDDYLMTLGHFLQSLDALGIPYESVLITKM